MNGVVMGRSEVPIFNADSVIIEWEQPGKGLRIQLEIADPMLDTLTHKEREDLSQTLGKVAVLFSVVLARKELWEQSDEEFEQTLNFLTTTFIDLTEFSA